MFVLNKRELMGTQQRRATRSRRMVVKTYDPERDSSGCDTERDAKRDAGEILGKIGGRGRITQSFAGKIASKGTILSATDPFSLRGWEC